MERNFLYLNKIIIALFLLLSSAVAQQLAPFSSLAIANSCDTVNDKIVYLHWNGSSYSNAIISPGTVLRKTHSGTVTGTGTLNTIPLWAPNGSTLGNSFLSQSGTSLRLNSGKSFTSYDPTKIQIDFGISGHESFQMYNSVAASGAYSRIYSDTAGMILDFNNNGTPATLYLTTGFFGSEAQLLGSQVKLTGTSQIQFASPLTYINGSLKLADGTQGSNKLLQSDASGNASWSSPSSAGIITGSLTANYIPKATAATTIANSLLYDTGTNIGIGTTSPISKLDIVGGLNVSTNETFTKETNHTISVNNSTTSGVPGGTLTVRSATGGTEAAGGQLLLVSGDGGSTVSGSGGQGKFIAITSGGGGAATGSGGNGGSAQGIAINSGPGGSTTNATGSNGGNGGVLQLIAGSGGSINSSNSGATSGAGGALQLYGGSAGNANSGTGNVGGAVTIQGGDATRVATGGAVNINAGDSPLGTKGQINIGTNGTTNDMTVQMITSANFIAGSEIDINAPTVKLVTGIPVTGKIFTCTNADGTGTWSSPATSGTVTDVTGTTNRITSTGGTTPAIDISPSYVGQSSITTLGTVVTGAWNGSAVSVPYGGTGNTSTTAYAVQCGGTTSTGAHQNVSGVGTSGQVLTSNGAGALPTWQAASGGVTSLAAIGSSSNANGATISGSTLNLEPASASFGGVVTTGAQTFGGVKTLTAPIFVGPALGTPASGVATNLTGLPLTTGVTGILGSTNGGSGINNAGPLTWGAGGTLGTAAYTAASAYEVPLTFSTGLNRLTNTITNNLSVGVSGGQTAIGGTASGNALTLQSTSNATRGKINFGSSALNYYDEQNRAWMFDAVSVGQSPFTFNGAATNSYFDLKVAGTNYGYIGISSGAILSGAGTNSLSISAINRLHLGSGGVIQQTLNGVGTYFGPTNVSASALAHFAAGTTAAGTSPIKFTLTSAAYNTTPEAGALGPNANGVIQTVAVGGTPSTLQRSLFTGTADATSTNTTSDASVIPTGVGTTTIKSGDLIVGRVIKIYVGGVYSTPAITGGTATVKVKIGSTTVASVATTALLTNASGLRFEGYTYLTVRSIGASGSVVASGNISYAVGVAGQVAADSLDNGGAATTVDTTADRLLDVTVAWDTASASKIVKVTTATFEILN